MACEYCTEPIVMDQPCSELLCHHKVHTECMLRQAATVDILDMRCAACREWIVPRQIVDEAEAVHGQEGQDEVVRYMWEHEPQFKASLEGLREARTKFTKAEMALRKKTKEMVANLKVEVEPLVSQVREKVRTAKAAFKAIPEHKEATKTAKSQHLKTLAFRRRWGVGLWQVRSALQDIAAARTLVNGVYGNGYGRQSYMERNFNVRII